MVAPYRTSPSLHLDQVNHLRTLNALPCVPQTITMYQLKFPLLVTSLFRLWLLSKVFLWNPFHRIRSLSQPLTNGETLRLNWISANYLKKSAHPTWMTDSLKTGVTPAQTLIEAIGSTNVNIRLAKCMKTYALCHIPVTSASLQALHKSNNNRRAIGHFEPSSGIDYQETVLGINSRAGLQLPPMAEWAE